MHKWCTRDVCTQKHKTHERFDGVFDLLTGLRWEMSVYVFPNYAWKLRQKTIYFQPRWKKKLQDVSWHQTSSHPCDQNKRKVFVYISTLLYGGNELYQPMSQRQSSQNKKSDMSQAVLFSSHMTVYYKAALVDFFVDSLGRRNIYSNQ